MKIVKHQKLLILSLSGLLAVGGLMMNAISKFPTNWIPAQRAISQGLLTKIMSENSTGVDIDPEATKVLKLKGGIKLIDFNSPDLCGRAGCVYAAYTKEGSRKLHLILQPQPDLFTISQESRNGIPCLEIKQPSGDKTIQHTYCYEGDKFIKTFSEVNNPS
ncbi:MULTISPECIES: hypothetical protein [unclassified Coleofasciculus]|uniref:hypothetical protein n=1 Tax=unclassified Coleofasciculus TaxID=2692782 RepID=UPI001880F812|nr:MULTISPECIES: hypothetical protein [unclassified Coleofasciculus]MBE9128017.1 hypothetical protein [Coleofasciculus sp. LEGE 07081]MBE9150543.1 hypothetical protein [Coleofasciculus sp. LEGE 07092]